MGAEWRVSRAAQIGAGDGDDCVVGRGERPEASRLSARDKTRDDASLSRRTGRRRHQSIAVPRQITTRVAVALAVHALAPVARQISSPSSFSRTRLAPLKNFLHFSNFSPPYPTIFFFVPLVLSTSFTIYHLPLTYQKPETCYKLTFPNRRQNDG